MARRKTPADDKPSQPAAPKTSGGDRLYTDQVRLLVDLMVANDLTSLEIVNGDLKVALGRGQAALVASSAVPAASAAANPVMVPSAAAIAAAQIDPSAVAAAPVEKLLEIKSPMVGTFYSAPSPDSDPYVAPGARVTPDTVVCIIEAMKVMNEIKAECAGTIVEVAVENGRPVEYGQELFRVRP